MTESRETAEYSQREKPRVSLSAEEKKRYTKHGIAKVVVSVISVPNHVELDISNLSQPKHAWFGKYTVEGPIVIISSGKKALPTRHIPGGIVTLDPNQEAVGLLLSIHYNVSPLREIPFNVGPLQPIYRAGTGSL